jgi:hypothetical protein
MAWPLVASVTTLFEPSTTPETRSPELSTVMVPVAMLALTRKPSLLREMSRPPALLWSVMLPVVNAPDVSIPRVVAVIAPELSMTTPGLADPPVHVMVFAAYSVPPLAIVPVSLFDTDLGVVSVTPLFTVKEAMIVPPGQGGNAAGRPSAPHVDAPHLIPCLDDRAMTLALVRTAWRRAHRCW